MRGAFTTWIWWNHKGNVSWKHKCKEIDHLKKNENNWNMPSFTNQLLYLHECSEALDILYGKLSKLFEAKIFSICNYSASTNLGHGFSCYHLTKHISSAVTVININLVRVPLTWPPNIYSSAIFVPMLQHNMNLFFVNSFHNI